MSSNHTTEGIGRRCAVVAAVLVLSLLGCVERRMTIRTNPPGALVYVDDNEIGITPVSTSFIYYGNRKIRIVKDGYETLTVIQPVSPPWYEIPPIDFISETLVPGNLRDQRTLDYQLRPQGVVPKEQLLGRAENLRCGTQSATGLAAPGYRVNPPSSGPAVPGAAPVGSQPNYQLPPGAPTLAEPPGPIYTPPPSPLPGPASGGAIYQPPSSVPADAGSQPNYPLPPSAQ